MALSNEELNNINASINGDFETLPLRQFLSLEINRPYLICTLSMTNSKFGKCVLATLFDDNSNCKFKCFLPKRVVEHLSEDILKRINLPNTKYTVSYTGQSKPTFKGANCRPLLKFGYKEMWMQYASEHWARATDLDTAIERLKSELSCMSFDRLHATNYDLNYCYDEEQVKKLEEESEMYDNGSELCVKYSRNILNLEQFCEQMITIGLKSFIEGSLLAYLPYTIRQKYQLKHQYTVESEDTQDNDDSYTEETSRT